MTTPLMQCLQPLDPDAWDPSLRDVRRRIGSPLNIHCVIARHPELMVAYAPLREHVVKTSSLHAEHRELLVLRVAHLSACDDERRQHVMRGLRGRP